MQSDFLSLLFLDFYFLFLIFKEASVAWSSNAFLVVKVRIFNCIVIFTFFPLCFWFFMKLYFLYYIWRRSLYLVFSSFFYFFLSNFIALFVVSASFLYFYFFFFQQTHSLVIGFCEHCIAFIYFCIHFCLQRKESKEKQTCKIIINKYWGRWMISQKF